VAAPEEIAAAITFLASKEAGNINGAILAVDDGWSAA
jgi:NAD(P)-dependent dehydrogenase (short-subunit alcohol dehydrogenase family)